MKERKFKLTNETIKYHDRYLFRIEALKDFSDVKKGDKGGYIEKESNLSQLDDCWVYDSAKVFNNAEVYGNAKIYDQASVFDEAMVFGDAEIHNFAKVFNNATVCDSAAIFHNAIVGNNAQVYDNAQVYGDSQIMYSVEVFGNAAIYGNAKRIADKISTPIKPKNITDKIKTFEDVCKELECTWDENYWQSLGYTKSELAYKKLCYIVKVFNEGWKPNFRNSDREAGFYPYFEFVGPAKTLSYISCLPTCSYRNNAPQLLYKDAALAAYAGKQFEDIYNDYLLNY